MEISLVVTDADIGACFPILRQLRPDLVEADFVARVRAQERQGYRIASLTDGGPPAAVAGFRIGDNLAWGRFLYVDDLVTDAGSRSRGYGKALLAWLHDHARAAGCRELHLDSGIGRRETHRFYRREEMEMTSYHFRTVLG